MCFVLPDEHLAMRNMKALLCCRSGLVANRIVNHSTVVPCNPLIQNVNISFGKTFSKILVYY